MAIKKAILRFGGAAVILGILAWGLLFSVLFANNRLAIPVRKKFYERVLEKKYLPDELPYIVMAKNIADADGETEYEYEMTGRFVSADYGQRIIVLQDKSGKEWKFKFPPESSPKYINRLQLVIYETAIDRETKLSRAKQRILGIDPNAPELTFAYFQAGEIVDIKWSDERRLFQILQANKNPENFIRIGGSEELPIRKIIGK